MGQVGVGGAMLARALAMPGVSPTQLAEDSLTLRLVLLA